MLSVSPPCMVGFGIAGTGFGIILAIVGRAASDENRSLALGIATAAGCQLVATCDLAIAASGAAFATNGINNGLFCATPAVAVSRRRIKTSRSMRR